MTQRFVVHPTHPQSRLLRQAAQILRDGGLVAMPTDACYVVACHLDDKAAVERLRALRGLDDTLDRLLASAASHATDPATAAALVDRLEALA